MIGDNNDHAQIERAAFTHFMAGFDGPDYPLREVWPGAPGKAYCFELIRRQFGMSGVELARKLPIFRSH